MLRRAQHGGFFARDTHREMEEAEPPARHEYYERFKMHLNPSTRETGTDERDMLVKPAGGVGRGRSITDIAAALLAFLKNDAMRRIASQFKGEAPQIRWVLTVPAIWDEFAKNVMAQAAVRAGAWHDVRRCGCSCCCMWWWLFQREGGLTRPR